MKATFPVRLAVCLSILFTGLLNTAFAQFVQSRHWYIDGKSVDWANLTTTPLPGSPYIANNLTSGAYYTNGTTTTTEFSIADGYVNQWDGSNDVLRDYTDYFNTIPGFEVIAIPKPGAECDRYYIIYSKNRVNISSHPSQQTGLMWAEFSIDVNSGLITNRDNILWDYTIYNQTNANVFPPAIAVGKLTHDQNGTPFRFLYAVVANSGSAPNYAITTRVYKYIITGQGITEVDLTPTIANNYIEFNGRIHPAELELSHRQDYLAFARNNVADFPTSPVTDLVVIALDGNGNVNSSSAIKTYDLTDVNFPNDDSYTGLEFHPTLQTL